MLLLVNISLGDKLAVNLLLAIISLFHKIYFVLTVFKGSFHVTCVFQYISLVHDFIHNVEKYVELFQKISLMFFEIVSSAWVVSFFE